MKKITFLSLINLFVGGCLSSSGESEGSSPTADSPENNEVLAAHNQARAKVGVKPLVWSNKLAQIAQRHAEILARKCSLQHSKNNLGENLYMQSGGNFSPVNGVRAWLSEEQYYDYASNSARGGQVVGHYTQIVWKDTKEVGCGYARSNCGVFMVCNYSPAGNIVGRRPY